MNPMVQRIVDVETLTPDQQLDLIGDLWERLSRSPSSMPLTAAQQAEVDRRSDDLDEDVREGGPLGIPWEDVLQRIRSRL